MRTIDGSKPMLRGSSAILHRVAWSLLVLAAGVLAAGVALSENEAPEGGVLSDIAQPTEQEGAAKQFKSLDQEVQALKKDVLELNRDLFILEEELLFPANTQVAVFVSMDVGEFFKLDSVQVKLDNKEVANYLYTSREADALLRGGVQRVYLGNLRVGDHEMVAFFTGHGPHERDYRRGATLQFEKGIGAKYVELIISDRAKKQQPEFVVKEWE